MTRRSGITMVDLIVSLTILVVVLTAVYGVFVFQNRTREAALEDRDIYGLGALVLDRLSRDLKGCWLPDGPTTSKIPMKFEAAPDFLVFLSTSTLSPDPATINDLAEIGYRLEPDKENPEVFNLFRRQDSTPDDRPDEGGEEILLARDIVSFQITMIDKTGTAQTMISARNRADLPRALKIELVLTGDSEQRISFSTITLIPLASPDITAPALRQVAQ